MRPADHRTIARILISLVGLFCLAARAFGHDLERTEVSVRFAPDATFVLDVANDPDWLLLRLEPFAVERGIPGRPMTTPARPLTIAERDAFLASFAPVVIDRVVLWVDGHEVRPATAEFIPPRPKTAADDLSPLGIYRLRGQMPRESRSLRWFYGIVIDPYPLTIGRADGRELKETIQGNAWSETLDLAGQFDVPPQREIVARYVRLGIRYVAWSGVGQILFVLGLLLMTLRLRPVVIQLTTFALAETIGAALTLAGILTSASRAVWPVIVLSIVYVVVESLLARELTRWRLAFIFVFGLFHGVQVISAMNALTVAPAEIVSASSAFFAAVLGSEGATVMVALLAANARKHRLGIQNSEFRILNS